MQSSVVCHSLLSNGSKALSSLSLQEKQRKTIQRQAHNDNVEKADDFEGMLILLSYRLSLFHCSSKFIAINTRAILFFENSRQVLIMHGSRHSLATSRLKGRGKGSLTASHTHVVKK